MKESGSVLEKSVLIFSATHITEILASAMLGSVIDLDHVIAAGSISYFDVTHLTSRPFGHSILFILLCTITVFLFGNMRASLLCFSALTSHMLRDALRRGLWLWPFGSTPALSFALVSMLYIMLPIVTAFLLAHRRVFSVIEDERLLQV
jgi:uncharacterized BrkB/YihY/UPF0761 family membrane protein